MKISVVLIQVLFASMAWASPNIGDKAYYSGEVNKEGQWVTMELTSEVTEYDASTGLYKRVDVTVLDGESKVSEKWNKPEELLAKSTSQNILLYCETGGIGHLAMATVPAGSFEVCVLTMNPEGELSIGVVPFGIVSYESPTARFALESYEWGASK